MKLDVGVFYFKEWPCEIYMKRYVDGNPCLQLTHATESYPVATATTNIAGFKVPDGYILIKDWSENEGMLECLTKAGVIEPTGEKVSTGFVQAHVAKLLIK